MPPVGESSKRKADAARRVMDRLATTNPQLRNKIFRDFSAGGFKWNAAVAADVQLLAGVDPSGAKALREFFADSDAVDFEASRGFAPFRGALDPVGGAAGQVGNLPQDILPAVGEALTPTSIVGFLSALSDPDTWLRVAQVVVGGVLVVVGVSKLAGVSPQQIVRAVPAGKMASVVKGQ